MRRNQNIEVELKTLAERAEEERLLTHQRISLGVSYIESINLTAIYSMFLGNFLHKFLEELGKYIMFPIAAAGSLIQAALAWREVYLSKGKSGNIVKAVVETVAAVAITTAVIGALVASAIFGVITPIIFFATTVAKTVYHAGATAYYAVRANTTKNPIKKVEYGQLATNNAIATAAGCLSSVAVVGVFLLGKVVMASIGIITGLMGAGLALYNGITSYNQSKNPLVAEQATTIPQEENKGDPSPVPIITYPVMNSPGLDIPGASSPINHASPKTNLSSSGNIFQRFAEKISKSANEVGSPFSKNKTSSTPVLPEVANITSIQNKATPPATPDNEVRRPARQRSFSSSF